MNTNSQRSKQSPISFRFLILIVVFDITCFILAVRGLHKMEGSYNDSRQAHVVPVFRQRINDTGDCTDKELLLQILADALKNASATEDQTYGNCSALPAWQEVTKLYGSKPMILGLEHCAAFRNNATLQDPLGGLRVAGFYNSGTNALEQTLLRNLNNADTDGRQELPTVVPWSKHRPLWTAKESYFLEHRHVLPVVVVRDPYRWMQSMCKTRYDLFWQRNLRLNGIEHCPNLVPSSQDEQNFNQNRSTFAVWLRNPIQNSTHDSLAALWSRWNGAYLNTSIPRLIVRMEDLIFHGPEMVQKLSECVGVDRADPYVFLTEAAKSHGRSADLATAMIKYGRRDGRYAGMTTLDLAYARHALSGDLMQALRYEYDDFSLDASPRILW
jgi:hypothetical protein